MEAIRKISILLILGALLSCKAHEPQPEVITNPPSTVRGYLVSYAKTGAMTAGDIISIGAEEGDVSTYANEDLVIYAIVYNSVNQGVPIELSGLVFVPGGQSQELAIIQHHHGTIIPGDNDEVPSTYSGGRKGSSEMYFIGATLASNGHVVSMPDYLGYGSSSDHEHPYTVHKELSEESVDMLLATRQLVEMLNLEFSGDVFLTGWSEGGGVGLATHRLLESQYSEEFNVKGSSLLAGPYDYFGFFKDILISRRDVSDINLTIYSWSVYSLNKAELNRASNTIWIPEVSNQIEALDLPSYKVRDIFQNSFIQGFVDETDGAWVSLAKENRLIEGWTPQGYVYFHSGTDDYIVPHFNSVHAHEYFQSVNANTVLYEYEGGDHYTPLYKYVTTTLDDFNSL